MNAIDMSPHASRLIASDSNFLFLTGTGEGLAYINGNYCIINKTWLQRTSTMFGDSPYWGMINGAPAWSGESGNIYYHDSPAYQGYVKLNDSLTVKNNLGQKFVYNGTLGMDLPITTAYDTIFVSKNGSINNGNDLEKTTVSFEYTILHCSDFDFIKELYLKNYTFVPYNPISNDILEEFDSVTLTLKSVQVEPPIQWVLDKSRPYNGWAGLYIPAENSKMTGCKIVGTKEYSFGALNKTYKIHEIEPPSTSYSRYMEGDKCVCYYSGFNWTLIVEKDGTKYKWRKAGETAPWEDNSNNFEPVIMGENDKRDSIKKFKWCGMIPYFKKDYVKYLELTE